MFAAIVAVSTLAAFARRCCWRALRSTRLETVLGVAAGMSSFDADAVNGEVDAVDVGVSDCHLSNERRRAFIKKLDTVPTDSCSCCAIVCCISFDGRFVSRKIACIRVVVGDCMGL